ncbi:DNA repair protein RecN [Sporomusa acidovorans]|uniref:DNA repair protein RecN n=1 Tax=Sporomusa acidovorans (strain ATCC 49682 / DSM 3132 / Mol) TaxID=1123286 RepID=A0ABZ3J3P5_SPOA4|nr:DNA repair protein RecN [Sporomusa acidovorans]OZC20355.1 DNA repair protein RecN [Sporomusa acidovorans DSM 3132]SDD36722.1 DNA repair protein RecN (Recombination protein N) [Sporomusa acidovorans]
MLKSLTVINFALIDRAYIEFVSGLNILTGETGAGKSILIDALSAIIGGRSSTDSIRSGTDYFRIEAVFDIENISSVKAILDEQGIPQEEDGTLILTRRLAKNGKNSIHVNGCQATLTTLRKVGEKLVDMHGQHENQALLKPEVHLSLTDAFASGVRPKLEEYRQIYKQWHTIKTELASLIQDSRERLQREEMLSWQTQEIGAAALTLGEEEKLESQVKILANSEKISNAISHSYALLNQGSKGFSGVVSCLAEIKRDLETAVRYDDTLNEQLAIVTDSLYQLEEIMGDLRDYHDNLDFNPGKLAKMEERLDVIHRLKKKYGATIEDILNYYENASNELAAITHYDERLTELEQEERNLAGKVEQLAEELNNQRQIAARLLSRQVSEHLADLGMPKAKFLVEVNRNHQYNIDGANDVAFLFSANSGEEARFLHKVASGGELSRIALAIKTVCSERDGTATMVFDEVDAGIGGQTAQKVAEKIARIAAFNKQVLCITHLPQIAAMADCHIYIEKVLEKNRTITQVTALTTKEQVSELARMTSGEVTKLSMDNAAQMLELAKRKKKNWGNKV